MKAWLGLGSNQQQPIIQVRQAITRLQTHDEIELQKISSFYQTPPWGDEQQDDFVNAVVQIETALPPLPLLRAIQSIEDVMGRLRSERRWGPRIIDIDLLLYGEAVFRSSELEIPHPRMHERAFVLLPLSELDSTLLIPGYGAVNACLSEVECDSIVRISDA